MFGTSKAFTSMGRGGARRRQRRAFTLIELLVVIAIIALLLSLLTPSLSQARMLARRVACQTQLHAIGLAVRTYGTENGDRLPWNRTKSYTSFVPTLQTYLNLPDESWTWAGYSKLDKPYILWCPEVTTFRNPRTYLGAGGGGTSYCANFATLNWWQENMGGEIKSTKRFPYNNARHELAMHPATTMMFMESMDPYGFPQHHQAQSWLNGLPRFRYRHPQYEAMNVLYFDGRAVSETFDYIFYKASRCTMDSSGHVTPHYSPPTEFWYINYEP